MKQLIGLFISLFFGVISIFAQANWEEGYYLKDGKVKSGIFFEKAGERERSERVVIPSQKQHNPAVLSPSDIDEYGFADGRRYISGEILITGISKKVFLEEMFTLDSIAVYYYPAQEKDLFFFQQGKESPQLVRDEEHFWTLFHNKDCPEITAFINTKRKKSIKRGNIDVYRRAYTDCNTNLFPTFHFGVTTELGLFQPDSNKKPEGVSYDPTFSFMVGLFAQIPLDECISFHPEVLYSYLRSNMSLSGSKRIARSSYSRGSIQLPMVFRYTFNYNQGKILPYVDLGLLLDIRTTNNDGTLYKTQYPDEDERPGSFLLTNTKTSPLQYGAVLGGGIEYKLTRKQSVYAGLRLKFAEGGGVYESKEKLLYLSLNLAYGF